jgi:hypothetical protein
VAQCKCRRDETEHHFGIGRQAFNRNGGRFLLDAKNMDDSLRADVLFSNGEFRSVANDVTSTIFNKVKIESSIYKLFKCDRDDIKKLESIDDVGKEHLFKNWRIFLKACDRYAEKIKSQENSDNQVM